VDLRGSIAAEGAESAPRGRRRVYLPTTRAFVDVPVYDRYRLDSGARIEGPAVIEEAEATTVIWPHDQLAVDARRNLVISVAPRTGTDAAGAGADRGTRRTS
jgi:N-methylhydantoinase A/oxoprolinase/acetone carboxylase beta subunit